MGGGVIGQVGFAPVVRSLLLYGGEQGRCPVHPRAGGVGIGLGLGAAFPVGGGGYYAKSAGRAGSIGVSVVFPCAVPVEVIAVAEDLVIQDDTAPVELASFSYLEELLVAFIPQVLGEIVRSDVGRDVVISYTRTGRIGNGF